MPKDRQQSFLSAHRSRQRPPADLMPRRRKGKMQRPERSAPHNSVKNYCPHFSVPHSSHKQQQHHRSVSHSFCNTYAFLPQKAKYMFYSLCANRIYVNYIVKCILCQYNLLKINVFLSFWFFRAAKNNTIKQ
mgnify:CR=1 FL=1